MSNRRKNQTRTVTISLYAVKDFDFEALLSEVEGVLNQHSDGGAILEWDINTEA